MKYKLPLILVLVLLIFVSSVGIVAFGATADEEEGYPSDGSASWVEMYKTELPNIYNSTTWHYKDIGSNAKGSSSVDSDGSVSIKPASGKGKVADSNIGMCFYYTEVDATKYNFYIEATITVTAWKGDNQNGFGIICTDTLGNVGQDTNSGFVNYVASGCLKTTGTSYNVPAGRSIYGYISPDGSSPSEDAAGSGDSLVQTSVGALVKKVL